VARAPATAPLARRAEAALRDGRPTDALEVARQHARERPGPEADALLRRCYLAAAESLVARNTFREAHPVLAEAERVVVDDPEWWERLATLRADLGDHGRALQLLDKVPDSGARPRVLGHVADRAVREGPGGNDLLPPDLRPGFELVRQAFAHYEAGRDEAAREALTAVGLSSPFLEWKLLLRGLIAWSANDTRRALENWSRLSPDRLPARLAAPFRLTADKAFAATLPADRAQIVARQADQLAGGLNESLRRLRKQLANEDTIPAALETARVLVPELKRMAPDLVPRLANVVYWALISGGQPEDLPRYNRVFGPPADDPQFYRLQALVMEQMRRLDMAHGMWGKYEEWIAKTPARWPGPQRARARALVLERMGRIARDWLNDDRAEEVDGFEEIFAFFDRDRRKKPAARKPLKPSADECFRRAGELAPDWPAPALELLREYSAKPDKAVAAIEDLLRRFPDNLPILESAAGLYERLGDTAKAHDYLKRALAANPLDRELRQQAAGLALNAARRHAEAGEFDAARAGLREAADLGGPALAAAVHALGTAAELKAGDAAAATRHREALTSQSDSRLAAAYRLMVEGSRLKLKKKDLGPHQATFTDGLSGAATVGELAALLDALDQYRREPAPYRGLKTHEKKILDRIAVAARADQPEDELVRLGLVLHRFRLWKPLRELAEAGMARFPGNAHFVFFAAEAAVSRQRSEYVGGRAGALYLRVKRLLDAAADDRYRRLQELLDERQKQTPDVEHWLNARWEW
jgi:tetratricopeptide (TPR) repeat protein